ncbi:1-acyl-sn-glycerol-3-phosphate acyltransferase [Alkalibaculum sp. M08DMB]|uniref:1-acyl-sn-glycerol-3-phosphate acyltransferase n=1 Tax=Alkalibaculum sporogenes TaxID=2655001 RepID=A0A6A7K7M4_9FIRM|nr:lysophospholipid acyltransferase family protein [Alkalibaculum sporogenes]MPW25207.1 1-acyl-sn-glycerol-3-phosphate acyltransferase [Alkalibaculum sporogenes]
MIYYMVRFIVNIYISMYYKFEVVGIDKIPDSGSLIICSNHIHWADPVIVACKSTTRQVHYLGKSELFKNNFISWFLKQLKVIPINRGKNDVGAIKNSLRVLKDKKTLGIFPEGTRVSSKEEKKPEAGMAMLAIKSKATVIPIGLIGNYKFRSKILINIGEPILLDEYHDKKVNKEKLEEISLEIMKEIKKLT